MNASTSVLARRMRIYLLPSEVVPMLSLIHICITAIVATVTIVCGMMFIGYTAGNAMGFSHMSSIFLGGMLSMSSTAIVFLSLIHI